MNVDALLNLSIDSLPSEIGRPIDSLRFKGPMNLYCNWCLHSLRLVHYTKAGISCSDCGQTLDIAPQSFFDEEV